MSDVPPSWCRLNMLGWQVEPVQFAFCCDAPRRRPLESFSRISLQNHVPDSQNNWSPSARALDPSHSFINEPLPIPAPGLVAQGPFGTLWAAERSEIPRIEWKQTPFVQTTVHNGSDSPCIRLPTAREARYGTLPKQWWRGLILLSQAPAQLF